nr:Inner membrane protein ygjV [Klebsiella pneumoniae]
MKRRLFSVRSLHDRVLAGPGVGVIAFLIGITTFINRDERRFRLQLAVYSAIIGVHFS